MKGYISKEFKNLNILVSENIMSSLTDKKLCDMVSGLFNENRVEHILKKRPTKRYLNPNSAIRPASLKDTRTLLLRN
jgi:hypothetical protein